MKPSGLVPPESRLTRRALLRRSLLTGLGLVSASVLAACQPSAPPAAPAKSEAPKPAAGAAPTSAPAATTAPAAAAKPAEAARPAEAAKPAQAAPAGAATGLLTIAVESQSTGLDPQGWAGGSINTFCTPSVYDSLVGRDNKTKELQPRLAKSWERVDDTTWRFKLQDGVKFHNGAE